MTVLFETPRFLIEVGTLHNDPEPQYLVKNKETRIVEFCNASLYFARDWALQFTQALAQQEEEMANRDKVIPASKVETNGTVN